MPAWAGPVILSGDTSVNLFFVASAFSLCRSARPSEHQGWALASFAARRIFRIAPLFYVILLVSLLRDRFVFGAEHTLSSVAANIFFVFNLWPGHEEGIAWASWTIGVEMLFYVVFPFLLTQVGTVSRALVAVLITLLLAEVERPLLSGLDVSASAQLLQQRYGILHYLPVFLSGILAYRVFEHLFRSRIASPAVGGAILLAAAYLYASLLQGTLTASPFHDAYYWQAVIFGSVVLGLSMYPARWIVNRTTLYLGRVSYSLYLTHPIVVSTLIPVFRLVERQGWSATLSFASCAGMTLVSTLAIATVTYTFIEAPGVKLGSTVSGWLSRKALDKVV